MADQIKSRIGAVHYVPLAEMARVQGDVRISYHSDIVAVLSGPLSISASFERTGMV